ncbi:MAG: FtsB family cell division protein [Bacteriovoracaceae bacterium]
MAYDFDRSQARNSRNFEQRPFLSRDGRELKVDADANEDAFAVFDRTFEQEMDEEPQSQNFEPEFLEEEQELSPSRITRGRAHKEVEQEFDKPIKKKAKKSPAKVGYLGMFDWKGLSTGEKLSKAGWIFVCFLFFRLIFMDSGIIDFIKMEKRLDARLGDLRSIQMENEDLKTEIDLIKNNTPYQKKLVRDHLGAIDGNEYLLLFPTESEPQSN